MSSGTVEEDWDKEFDQAQVTNTKTIDPSKTAFNAKMVDNLL
jgi:hypothetical protein